jgi:hypothetical protein
MFCRFCGADLPADSSFCSACGQSLEQVAPVAAPAEVSGGAPAAVSANAPNTQAAAALPAKPSPEQRILPRTFDGSWGGVAKALRLYFTLSVAALSLGLVVVAISVAMAASREREGAAVVSLVGGLGGLGLAIPSLMALFRYRKYLPSASNGGGTATASCVLASIQLGLSVLTLLLVVISLDGRRSARDVEGIQGVVGLLSGGLGIAFFFTLVASLKAVARFGSERGLEQWLGRTQVLFGVTIGVTLIALLMAISARGQAGIVVLAGLAALGCLIWTLVYYLIGLSRTAKLAETTLQTSQSFD